MKKHSYSAMCTVINRKMEKKIVIIIKIIIIGIMKKSNRRLKVNTYKLCLKY